MNSNDNTKKVRHDTSPASKSSNSTHAHHKKKLSTTIPTLKTQHHPPATPSPPLHRQLFKKFKRVTVLLNKGRTKTTALLAHTYLHNTIKSLQLLRNYKAQLIFSKACTLIAKLEHTHQHQKPLIQHSAQIFSSLSHEVHFTWSQHLCQYYPGISKHCADALVHTMTQSVQNSTNDAETLELMHWVVSLSVEPHRFAQCPKTGFDVILPFFRTHWTQKLQQLYPNMEAQTAHNVVNNAINTIALTHPRNISYIQEEVDNYFECPNLHWAFNALHIPKTLCSKREIEKYLKSGDNGFLGRHTPKKTQHAISAIRKAFKKTPF